MKGKDYGNNHGNDSKFGLQIIGAVIPPLDFIEAGELGSELRTFKTDDGNEHVSGDTDAYDFVCVRYPTDAAQSAYLQAWLLACESAAPDAVRSANFFKYGPGETVAETHYIGRILVKRFKPSGGSRASGGASRETWTFSVHRVRKVK